MCGGVHYGEVEGLVSVERWSCSMFPTYLPQWYDVECAIW